MTLTLPVYDGTNAQFIFDLIAQSLPGNAPRVTSGGKKNIATSESTTSTSYTTLTTPDTVTVVLPTDGLIAVWYQAIWQNTVASNARAAVFVGTNQLKIGNGTTAPAVQETNGPAETNDDGLLSTVGNGLLGLGGVGATTEVTTGQVVGQAGTAGLGGPVYTFAAAGTYDISIKFKNNAAGTLTVKKRHLWVAAYSFA